MTVEELKAVLVGLGFPKSELNKLNKDSLMELHANAMEDQVVDNVNLDADFEEVYDSPELEF